MGRRVASVTALALVAACAAQRPVIYPNQHARDVGDAQQQRDVDACIAFAKETTSSGQAKEVARDTAIGGSVGAAAGAAGGAVTGNAGRGAAAGAAGGAAAGFMSRLLRPRPPSPAFVGVVNRCLQERGYEVAGWE